MTKWSLTSACIALMLLVAVGTGQERTQGSARPTSPPDAAPNEVLLKFASGLGAAQRDGILKGRGAGRIKRFASLDIDYVRLPSSANIHAQINALRKVEGVLAVQANFRRRVITNRLPTTPNDPLFLDDTLWGIKKIKAPEAWSTFIPGSPAVIIANIDTGVDYTHPDLAANMWRNPLEIPGNGVDDDLNGYVDDVHGIDVANGDGDPRDDQGHGTHTIGTAAAVGNNGIGVVGVTWNTRVMSCKFLDASGFGTDAGAIECFNYIVAMRSRGENIRVTSNSWGEQRTPGLQSTVLEAAIDTAGAVGILNVFGAGNDGTNNDTQPFDPASYASPSIIAVASSNANDRRSFFSNYGATSVDIAAPGENIVSTYPGGAYESASGTSMATPHVAGAAALLMGMNPGLTPLEVKQLLMSNADQVGNWAGKVASNGRLNVFRAASAVGTVEPNEPPTVTVTQPAAGAVFKVPVTVAIAAVANDTDGTVQYVTFFANGSPIGQDSSSPYTAAWTPAPGVYTITAIATDDKFSIGSSPPVSVTVLDNEPPVVSLTSPAAGAVFTSPATVTLTADASDPEGTVQSVTFFANDVEIATVTTAPYTFTWSPAYGSYTLTARAVDNLGASKTSAPVAITVNPLSGRINVALAANGGSARASTILNGNYPPSGTINGDRKGLNWGAGGGWNDGTQNQGPDWLEVEFAGMRLIEEINVFSMQDNYTSPVEPTTTMTFTTWGLRGFDVQYWDGTTWQVVPGGAIANNNLVWRRVVFAPIVTSKIRVFVTAALNGYSRVIEAEAWGVSAGVNSPPDVAITAPAANARLVAPSQVVVEASASDIDGVVESVQFFANGVSLGMVTGSPWRVTWNAPPLGDHVLTAIAIDNQGGKKTSVPVPIKIVAENVAPVVALTGPLSGATFTAGANITLTATAADSDGTIATVAFLANGSLIGTDNSDPFSVVWASVPAGSYTLTAMATDDAGASTTTAPITITVLPDPLRMNVALATNGGVASASSVLNANYPASATINGDRRGLNWGAGGGWNDGTPNAGPDWLQVNFNGSKTIDVVNVFSMQDNYTAPLDPTPTMTFTSWGVRGFEVQYWTGTTWAIVPGGVVTNNNLVWRQVAFAPITTSRIRINVTQALQGYARLIEVEAWGMAAGGGNVPPMVDIVTPADGASFVAPAALTVTASATDSDGSITSVEFFSNGVSIGTSLASPYAVNWSGVAAGSYSLTAVATDNTGASTTSAPITIVVTEPQVQRMNVALASNGGVAMASSVLGPNYPPSGAINGDRRGLGWGAGGGWNDGTLNTSPDWIEIAFAGSKTIDEVNVFSMQDNFSAPLEPTPTMTFTTWGLRAFQIQYWDGSAWVPIPGASITNNNLVWRRFTFTPVTTTRIRVHITAALNGYSRVIEVEAWGR